MTLQEFLPNYDKAASLARAKHAEALRAEILALFPLSSWADMPLERYALGQPDSSQTFCRWMEFKLTDLGSISGGSSLKHAIFKRRNKDGWYYPSQFANEQEAWHALRAGIVEMLERASAGRWEELSDLMPLQYSPALWQKALHVYFPDEIISVYSLEHQVHFLYLLTGAVPKDTRKLDPIQRNRSLLEALRALPEVGSFSSVELSYLLYEWADPRTSKSIYKIAPGEDARFWPECLAGGYVCVGWPAVGDLTSYENTGAFQSRFKELYESEYGSHPGGKAAATRKARELWKLAEIEPGDLIVANQGTSRILAVGEVLDPPYEWAGDGVEFPHRIRVKWDTSRARTIKPQPKWGFATIARLGLGDYERLVDESGNPVTTVPIVQTGTPDKELASLAERLEERRQLILYGPPGTGKTYTAKRFLLHWLANDVNGTPKTWTELTKPDQSGVAQVTPVTFHPSYSYEDFVEGYRPAPSQDGGLRLRLEDGIFKRVCHAAAFAPVKRFVVLIDEINRGNLPRIFGELITIIEADKRGMHVVLPQSKELFHVPENVFIVGTMNTADRSIKVLDAAFRRRFAFHELMPDASLLAGRRFGELALEDFFEYLNAVITRKEGREKQIGHAVFISDDSPVDLDEFGKRIRYEVIPLLQEYCYEDYGALAEYLGPELVDVDASELRWELLDDPQALASALAKLVVRKEGQ